MKKGNPQIKAHAKAGGIKLLALYGTNYFSRIGKKGRKKQLIKKKK